MRLRGQNRAEIRGALFGGLLFAGGGFLSYSTLARLQAGAGHVFAQAALLQKILLQFSNCRKAS